MTPRYLFSVPVAMRTVNTFLLFLVLSMYDGRANCAYPTEEYNNGEHAMRGGGGGEKRERERETLGELSKGDSELLNSDLQDWLADMYLSDILKEKELMRRRDQQNNLQQAFDG